MNHLLSTLLGTALTLGVPSDAFAATASPAKTGASAGVPAVKIARSFHTCSIVEGSPLGKDGGYWPYDGIPAKINDALGQDMDYDGFLDEIRPTIRLHTAPIHGTVDGDLNYRPNPGFEGVDGLSLAFDLKGKTYLSVQKFIVSIPRSEKHLPGDCKEAWKLPPIKKSDNEVPLGTS